MGIKNCGLRTGAINFCLQQLTRKLTKPRGRRFSLEEKIMSLALYKTFGSGYRFLSKWFNLSFWRTLSRLLQKIPVGPDINKFLFDNLKMATSHFEPTEKICMLMFAEISLMPYVNYDKTSDEIIGIKKPDICDHALVFMVRGITRKWKQTIRYSFCRGTTKVTIIKNLLVGLIKQLNETGKIYSVVFCMYIFNDMSLGLQVVATICDQGAQIEQP